MECWPGVLDWHQEQLVHSLKCRATLRDKSISQSLHAAVPSGLCLLPGCTDNYPAVPRGVRKSFNPPAHRLSFGALGRFPDAHVGYQLTSLSDKGSGRAAVAAWDSNSSCGSGKDLFLLW